MRITSRAARRRRRRHRRRIAARLPCGLVGRDGSQALQSFCGSRLVSFNGGLFNWMGGQLRAVNPATGEKQWGLALDDDLPLGADVAAGDPAAAPPAIANGKLFVATRGGQLLRVDPVGGAITGRVNLRRPGRLAAGDRPGACWWGPAAENSSASTPATRD